MNGLEKKEVAVAFLILAGMWIGFQALTPGRREKSVIMAGSVAMETFAEAIAEVMEEETGVTVKPEFIGSSAGIEALLKGKAQVALVSRYVTKEEKKRGIEEYIAAYDGIVVIVNAENTIENLSKEELSDIFTGKIKNWRELGGIDEPIVVIGREQGSGTRDAFEELLSIKGRTLPSSECDSIGVVKIKVGLLRGAIGYVSLESVKEEADKVKILAIESIKPDTKSIGDGKYFLVRPFILATYGEKSCQSEAVNKIFELLECKQGEIIFEKAGVGAAAKDTK